MQDDQLTQTMIELVKTEMRPMRRFRWERLLEVEKLPPEERDAELAKWPEHDRVRWEFICSVARQPATIPPWSLGACCINSDRRGEYTIDAFARIGNTIRDALKVPHVPLEDAGTRIPKEKMLLRKALTYEKPR